MKKWVGYLADEDAPAEGEGPLTSRRGFFAATVVDGSTTFLFISAAGSAELDGNGFVGVPDRELSALALNCFVHSIN